MIRVGVQPELLRWARKRVGFSLGALARRFSKLEAWERREAQPTLKQIEAFANASYTSVGVLFLQEPSIERIPVRDFRTVDSAHFGHLAGEALRVEHWLDIGLDASIGRPEIKNQAGEVTAVGGAAFRVGCLACGY